MRRLSLIGTLLLVAGRMGFLAALLFASLPAHAQSGGGPYGYFIPGPIKKLPNGGRPLKKVPFPEIVDWSSLHIKLQRSYCFGTCPAYLVEIDSEGTVNFEGEDFVVITGKHTARISKDAVHALFDAFKKAEFFWALDEYRAKITDLPTYALAISFDGHSKKVIDYAGQAVGMPKEIIALENLVDASASTEVWVKGNANSFQSLRAEGWDFRKSTTENLALIASAAKQGNAKLVDDLLAAGLDAKTRYGCKGLEGAARAGNLDIVNALIGAGAPVHYAKKGKQDYDCDVLAAASLSGIPSIVGKVIERHPDINWQDERGVTALMVAAEGLPLAPESGRDYAEVSRMLIKAGADVNLRDEDGKSAIMKIAKNAGVVRALISGGAKDINKRSDFGETTLMRIYDAETAQAMLESGANPWLVNNKGKNAFEEVSKTYGADNEAAKVIKRWMGVHPQPK